MEEATGWAHGPARSPAHRGYVSDSWKLVFWDEHWKGHYKSSKSPMHHPVSLFTQPRWGSHHQRACNQSDMPSPSLPLAHSIVQTAWSTCPERHASDFAVAIAIRYPATHHPSPNLSSVQAIAALPVSVKAAMRSSMKLLSCDFAAIL